LGVSVFKVEDHWCRRTILSAKADTAIPTDTPTFVAAIASYFREEQISFAFVFYGNDKE
jgi:hypothetical protein